jgi:hypothetical protein
MPTRAENILSFVDTRIAASQSCRNHCTESISAVNATKEDHNFAIDALDTLCFNQTNEINNAIDDVGTAYQSRVDAGCRSDLLWRVILHTEGDGTPSNPDTWTLECIRVQAGDYEQKAAIGIGSAFGFVEPNGTGGISSSHMSKGKLKNMIGFATDFYHGVKVASEPYSLSVSDTFVLGGIGTCGLGTNRLYLMNPTKGSSNKTADPNVGIKTGMIIQSEKPGFFPQSSLDIVGIGTTMADLRSIDAGISTYSTEITVLTLEDNTIGMASAPMLDGTYVNFIISKDPDSLSVKDWGVEMSDSPVVPQTLKMMTSSSIGTGTSVSYDNSGEPNVIREWNPFAEGLVDPNDLDSVVTRPEVGAGRSHYLVGLGSQPLFAAATPATVGQTIVVLAAALTNGTLYADVTTTCSTQQTNLVNAISTRDTLESALAADLSTFKSRLNLSNYIREDRNAVNMHVWAYRQQIGNCDTDESSDKEFKGVMESTEFLDIINGT